MSAPPPRIAERRARRRAQTRRRRLGALGAAVVAAVVVGLVVVLGGGNGGVVRSRRSVTTSRGIARRGVSTPAASAASAKSAEIGRLLRLGLPIYCGGPRGHEVAFTFDDGPGVYTHYALKKLEKSHEHATFFVVGRNIDLWPGYVKRELRVAAVEDHTYTHVPLISLSRSQVTYQLQATAEKIRAATGEQALFWRPPYDLRNATVDGIAQRLGLIDVLWDDDSQDSLGANYAQITKTVEAGLRPGAIIEMHENHGQTIRALTALLPALHRHHLRSVTVPQLLASDPPSLAQLHEGLLGCKHEGLVLRAGPAE